MVRARDHEGIGDSEYLETREFKRQTDLDLWFLVLLRKLMAWVAHVRELGEHHGEPEGEAIALSHSVD